MRAPVRGEQLWRAYIGIPQNALKTSAANANIFVVLAITQAPPGMFAHGQLLLIATTFHIVEPYAPCATPKLVQRLLKQRANSPRQNLN